MGSLTDMDGAVFLLSVAAAVGGEAADMAAERLMRYDRPTLAQAVAVVKSFCSNSESLVRIEEVVAVAEISHKVSVRPRARN